MQAITRGRCLAVTTLAALPLLAGLALAQAPNSATVRVVLPPEAANAAVLFDGQKTTQSGTERWYFSPSLEPGRTFSYEVTAIWTVDSKEVKRTKKASVSAGKVTVVDFTKADEPKKDEPKKDVQKQTAGASRTFHFTSAATLTMLPKDKTVKVWVPVPPTTADQDITLEKESVPGKASIGTEPQYGNKILFIEARPDQDGNLTFALTFKVTRREIKTDGQHFREPDSREKIERFLQADRLVPVGGKPLELVKDAKFDGNQLETAGKFYDVVNRHMKYSKEGKGWGNGDSEWACDSKFGNCTDFHSLFISLARSQKIPAKFEIGFPLPPKRGEGTIGGYHCWAWFLPDGKGWVPVDISEANRFPEMRDYYFGNLTENRVMFTTGRDVDLVPRQTGPALNYFIYPYAEVDGEAVPADQIQRTFSFKDVP
jgi:uncharacterized protein (TIGR03000 family)